MKDKIPEYKMVHNKRKTDLERLRDQIEYYLDSGADIALLSELHYAISDYVDEWMKE